MPSLTNRQVHAGEFFTLHHRQTIPSERQVRLTKTELSHTTHGVRLLDFTIDSRSLGTQTGIEVRFNLTAELRATPFISYDIQTETRGQTQETERTNGVEVLTGSTRGLCLRFSLVPVLVLRLVII